MKRVMFLIGMMLLSCECEEVNFNDDFTSGELNMATQNLVTTAYSPTWTVAEATAGYGFAAGTNVLKSGHGLLYYTSLGGTLNDRDTDLSVYWELALQESGEDRPVGQTNEIDVGGASLGDTIIPVASSAGFLVGDLLDIANQSNTLFRVIAINDPDVNTLTLDTPLIDDVSASDYVDVISGMNDIGVALFDNITDGSEKALVLVYVNGYSFAAGAVKRRYYLYIYDSGTYYPAKYKDGANYRTNAGWVLDILNSDEDVSNYSLKLTSNRYLKLFKNADLLELTADSLGANVTTIDIQNCYYGAGNTQYVPDASGFYVGVSSGAYDRVQTAGRYSYLDNIRVRQ